ncbi:MAG: hypothetical protein JWO38_3237 [Gemmataceae bacterium]|nr:hypothetical protein [Gemmataceae bacterium]
MMCAAPRCRDAGHSPGQIFHATQHTQNNTEKAYKPVKRNTRPAGSLSPLTAGRVFVFMSSVE